MTFKTSVDINNGYYGYWYKDKNNASQFAAVGRAVFVKDVFSCIEDNSVLLKISFDYNGNEIVKVIDRRQLFSRDGLKELMACGADVYDYTFKYFCDSIRLQEENQACKYYHKHLGWDKAKVKNPSTGKTEVCWYYKGYRSVGLDIVSNYNGMFDVKPMGRFIDWKSMVEEDVLGRPGLELAVLVGLSAVVVGLLRNWREFNNPIVHIFGDSSSGKTTAAFLAASVSGNPVMANGEQKNKIGQSQVRKSILGSWSSTDNAVVTMQVNNSGVLYILDELSKAPSKDLSSVVYSLSDGVEKARLNGESQLMSSAGMFTTSFLSLGENALLDRCKKKNTGLKMRVLQVSGRFTDDAAHADRIKNTCKDNYGFAGVKLAKYLLTRQEELVNIYDAEVERFSELLGDLELRDRVSKNYGAVLCTTAIVASEALGVDFDVEALSELIRNSIEDETANPSKSIGLDAYERVLEELFKNKDMHFDTVNGMNRSFAAQQHWGKYSACNKTVDNAHVVGEFAVRKHELERVIKDLGFESPVTVIKAWKEMSIIDCEKGKLYSRRKLRTGEDRTAVYVIRVYDDTSDSDSEDDGQQPRRVIRSKIVDFETGTAARTLMEDEDDD